MQTPRQETSLWKPEARILTSAVQMASFPRGRAPCPVKQHSRLDNGWRDTEIIEQEVLCEILEQNQSPVQISALPLSSSAALKQSLSHSMLQFARQYDNNYFREFLPERLHEVIQ